MEDEREKDSTRSKISPGFAARLKQLGPEEQVRAIVMLWTNAPRRTPKKIGLPGYIPTRQRLTPEERAAAVKAVRRSLAKALPDLDRVLERHHGKRLKERVDALGTIPVITTAAGIDALTSLDYVKAILEDQRVRRAS